MVMVKTWLLVSLASVLLCSASAKSPCPVGDCHSPGCEAGEKKNRLDLKHAAERTFWQREFKLDSKPRFFQCILRKGQAAPPGFEVWNAQCVFERMLSSFCFMQILGPDSNASYYYRYPDLKLLRNPEKVRPSSRGPHVSSDLLPWHPQAMAAFAETRWGDAQSEIKELRRTALTGLLRQLVALDPPWLMVAGDSTQRLFYLDLLQRLKSIEGARINEVSES